MDYAKTLQLPENVLAMKANLPQAEPQFQQQWDDARLYARLRKANQGKPKFILHDGPPYANGNIHIGHALNKIIKDIIVRHKTLQGYEVPYVPGWDTHGLPIEQAIVQAEGVDRKKMTTLAFRQKCATYAKQWVEEQKKQFQRLGILADWDHPYTTLEPQYEAAQIRLFGEMVKRGLIYKGLKPVYWSPSSESALAEAEIEYFEKTSPSIYVAFPLCEAKNGVSAGAELLIWTTTPWTLPANVGVAVHPSYTYVFVTVKEATQKEQEGRTFGVATQRLTEVAQTLGWRSWTSQQECSGKQLEYSTCAHPFFAHKTSLVVCGEHVTLDAGTGCVHTAPGHGEDDFFVGQQYGLEVLCFIDGQGKFTTEAGALAGLYYEKANAVVMDHVQQAGLLLHRSEIRHAYAHDWRTKKPVMYRATQQWFASIAPIRAHMLTEIQHVQWVPSWGESRLYNMIADRKDWCISRQRAWGVPIPILYCAHCGTAHVDDASIEWIASRIATHGTDDWFCTEADAWLPLGTACTACGHDTFTKETDIMDVWFDSGSSHHAVLQQREELGFPADLYVEGSDQYRGWFNSSLITSVATQGVAPYKAVLSHGFTMDAQGHKMSKSLGNTVDPLHVCDTLGADILRVWVASVEYKQDQRLSSGMLQQASDGYRKIRNTFRFMLGNLVDFDPHVHAQPFDTFREIDRYVCSQMERVRQQCIDAYDQYDFHVVYQAMYHFLAVEMSAFYLDVMKDTLYADAVTHQTRRVVQTVMYEMVRGLTPLLCPLIPHTAQEIWQHHEGHHHTFVQEEAYTPIRTAWIDDALEQKWASYKSVRNEVLKALETERKSKRITNSLEAHVHLFANEAFRAWIETFPAPMHALFLVSAVTVHTDEQSLGDAPHLAHVEVTRARGEKCARCWNVTLDVGGDLRHPTLCARCADVLASATS